MAIGNNKEKELRKDFDALLKNVQDLYTPEEIEDIRSVYLSLVASNKATAELIRPIVPVKQWINSSYFIGADVSNIYSYWKDVVIDIFSRPEDQRINQVILTGALGTGKSTTAVLIILRVIYELSCYKNISALFNLFGVSRIAFAYLSVTREQAQNTGFALLSEWIDSIPYFRENFKRKDKLDSMIVWPEERLFITYGSVANHFIGMNLIGSILDEANFFNGRSKEEHDFKMNSKVSELYTQIITRSQSRFIINGVNYSMSVLVSSSTVESSFTEERIAEAKDDVHTYIAAPALWDVKPWNYKGKYFYVFTGGDNIDPFVIKTPDNINMLLASKNLNVLENLTVDNMIAVLPTIIKSSIIKVPEEHLQAFQGNITIALQDLAGYSVSAANKLFNSHAAYNSCISPEIIHPFSCEQIILSTTKEQYQDGFMPIKSYLLSNIKFNRLDMPRYMHLDLALTGDSLGISMCYISGWQSIYKQSSNYEKLDGTTGEIEDEIRIPIITYDFMLRINPPNKPNKISLSKVRDFIIYLRNELKIKFGLITADQFQSEQLLQELSELGIKTGSLSVDRTPDAYLSFTNLIYEGRVNLYDYAPFKQELFGVVYYPAKKKVDHTATGSKDVADSVVGSAYNAIKAQDKSDITSLSLVDLFSSANKSDSNINDNIAETLDRLSAMLRQG